MNSRAYFIPRICFQTAHNLLFNIFPIGMIHHNSLTPSTNMTLQRCTPPTIPHTPPLYFLPAHPFSNQISTSNSGAPLRPLRPNHLPLPLDRRPAGPSRFHIRNSSRPLQIWPTNRRSISSSTDDRGDRG